MLHRFQFDYKETTMMSELVGGNVIVLFCRNMFLISVFDPIAAPISLP